jgi:NAD(P)-dependent dehydrogenase (short-subunit alcohol dehydrogenase family)
MAARSPTMVAEAEAEFGGVDILVNNAGIQFVSPVEDFPVEKWDAIIAINLSAAFHAIRAALPGMKQRKWGRIINTASAHALVASPFKSAYVAAKHGIAGLTKTVALETGDLRRSPANCDLPGYVWTPLVEKQIPETMKARGHDQGAGHQRRAAARPADQAVRHQRGGGGARCLPALPMRQSRSPASTCRSMAAGPRSSPALHRLIVIARSASDEAIQEGQNSTPPGLLRCARNDAMT